MKKSLTLVLVFLLLIPLLTVQAEEYQLYEMPRVKVTPIKDTQNDRLYELYIKLPENYSENAEKKYPVIYFTDAPVHIEILSASTYFLMDDAILVGISYQKDSKDLNEAFRKQRGEFVSRYRDFSIKKASNPEAQEKYRRGGASEHLAFIRNDVIKYVEKNYRTDPSNRSYFGYSMGGTFGAYILAKNPDTFKNYILGSGAGGNNIPNLTELLSKHKNLNANVYLSFGSLEDSLGAHVLKFVSLLKKRKDKTLFIKLDVIEGDHGTAFPATGVNSVKWLSKLTQSKE